MKRLLYAGIGLLALGAIAVAQVIGIPVISTSHPFADLIQILPNGSAQVGNQYATWGGVTNVYGYYKSPTSIGNGFLYRFGVSTNGGVVTYAQFGNSGAAATGYVYLDNAPLDGALDCFFSIGGVTALTMYAGTTSQTLNNGITAMTAATQYCYIYSNSNTTWDRIR